MLYYILRATPGPSNLESGGNTMREPGADYTMSGAQEYETSMKDVKQIFTVSNHTFLLMNDGHVFRMALSTVGSLSISLIWTEVNLDG